MKRQGTMPCSGGKVEGEGEEIIEKEDSENSCCDTQGKRLSVTYSYDGSLYSNSKTGTSREEEINEEEETELKRKGNENQVTDAKRKAKHDDVDVFLQTLLEPPHELRLKELQAAGGDCQQGGDGASKMIG